jgi:methylmalonyl-CoA mutase N-terminal domain/subunit
MGGMIPAIERGFPQTEIANASYEYQHSIETGEQKIVGVNAFRRAERRADRGAGDRRNRRRRINWKSSRN